MTGSDVDEEREMRELFKSVAGVDLEVDAYELRAILDANFRAGQSRPPGAGIHDRKGGERDNLPTGNS